MWTLHAPLSMLCRVTAVTFGANSGSDKVHAKFTLIPLLNKEVALDEELTSLTNGFGCGAGNPVSFARTMTKLARRELRGESRSSSVGSSSSTVLDDIAG